MEKRKNKKKLFAIIAGSALAFVLTIALSVSITLAYFGDTSSDGATVTMGAKVEIGDTTATAAPATVIPTQKTVVSATASLTPSGTQSVLFAVVDVDVATELGTLQSITTAAGWTKVGTTAKVAGTLVTDATEGDLFVLGTETALTKINEDPTIADDSTLATAEFTYSFIVPAALTNDVSTKTVTVKVQFIRLQHIYLSDGTTLTYNPVNYAEALTQIGGVTATFNTGLTADTLPTT